MERRKRKSKPPSRFKEFITELKGEDVNPEVQSLSRLLEVQIHPSIHQSKSKNGAKPG
jgi:hypothetical protein